MHRDEIQKMRNVLIVDLAMSYINIHLDMGHHQRVNILRPLIMFGNAIIAIGIFIIIKDK